MALFNRRRTGQAFRDLFSFRGRKPMSLPQTPKLMPGAGQSPLFKPRTTTPRLESAPPPAAPRTTTPSAPTPIQTQTTAIRTPEVTAVEQKEQISTPVTDEQKKSFVDLKPNQIVNKLGQVITKPTEKKDVTVTRDEEITEDLKGKEEPKKPTREEQIASLRSTALGEFQPTERESELQRQIDAIIRKGEEGIAGEEDRPIPMPFITGRQAAIERQTNIRLAPLQDELKRLQEDRLGKAQVATKQLEFMGGDEASKPVVVGKDSFLVDPDTGIPIFSPQSSEAVQNEADIDTWAKSVLDGEAQLTNVPSDIRTSVNNRIAALQASSTPYVSLTPTQKNQIDKIGDDLRSEQSYRDMLDVQSGFQSVQVGASFASGPGDLTMINGFQRMIDPGAVVREGEFRTVEEAQGFLQRTLNIPGKVVEGTRMSDQARNEMLNVATNLYNTKAQRFNDSTGKRFANRANIFNIDPGLVGAEFPIIGADGTPNNFDDVFNQMKTDFPDLSDNEIMQLMQEEGFSQVGGDTNLASAQVQLGSNLARQNNNPGNLRLANQPGATQGSGGFAKFETPQQGVVALFNDLSAKFTGNSPAVRNKLGRDAQTLFDVISVFCTRRG